MKPMVLCLVAVLLGFGCTVTPPGYTKAEFEALPEEQRNTIVKKYQAEQREIYRQRQAAKEQAILQAQAEIEGIRRNPKYGDIVTVNVESGKVLSDGKQVPIKPVTVELVRGETKSIMFPTKHGFITLTMGVDKNCGKLGFNNYSLCPNTGSDRGLGVWKPGVRCKPEESVKSDHNVKDLVLFIRWKPLPM